MNTNYNSIQSIMQRQKEWGPLRKSVNGNLIKINDTLKQQINAKKKEKQKKEIFENWILTNSNSSRCTYDESQTKELLDKVQQENIDLKD